MISRKPPAESNSSKKKQQRGRGRYGWMIAVKFFNAVSTMEHTHDENQQYFEEWLQRAVAEHERPWKIPKIVSVLQQFNDSVLSRFDTEKSLRLYGLGDKLVSESFRHAEHLSDRPAIGKNISGISAMSDGSMDSSMPQSPLSETTTNNSEEPGGPGATIATRETRSFTLDSLAGAYAGSSAASFYVFGSTIPEERDGIVIDEQTPRAVINNRARMPSRDNASFMTTDRMSKASLAATDGTGSVSRAITRTAITTEHKKCCTIL